MAQKKSNKVSVASVEQIMKEHFSGEPKTFEWYGAEIEYKETLPMAEMVAFVDGVADGCFDDEGEYQPAFKDYMINTYMIQLYTNIRMPQNAEKQYDILAGSDLVKVVRQLIDEAQFFAILEAIDEKIEHRRNLDIQMTRNNIRQLMDQWVEYGERMEALFENLTPADIEHLMTAVGETGVGLDEDKLVQAFLREKKQEDVPEIEDEENKIISIHRDDE